jgi:hypothetical protein
MSIQDVFDWGVKVIWEREREKPASVCVCLYVLACVPAIRYEINFHWIEFRDSFPKDSELQPKNRNEIERGL